MKKSGFVKNVDLNLRVNEVFFLRNPPKCPECKKNTQTRRIKEMGRVARRHF